MLIRISSFHVQLFLSLLQRINELLYWYMLQIAEKKQKSQGRASASRILN